MVDKIVSSFTALGFKVVDSIADASSLGLADGEFIVVKENENIYRYESNSTAIVNQSTVLSTADGGNSRWITSEKGSGVPTAAAFSAVHLFCATDDVPVSQSYKVKRITNDQIINDCWVLEGFVQDIGSEGQSVTVGKYIYNDPCLVDSYSKQVAYDSWVAEKYYVNRSIVSYNGANYICETPHSASSFSEVEQITTPWAANTKYERGDKIVHEGNYYYAASTFTSEDSFSIYTKIAQPWQPNKVYSRYDYVLFDGVVYRCAELHRSGQQFSLTKSINPWQPNTTYSNSTVVLYEGNYYTCLGSHLSGESFELIEKAPNNWQPLTNYVAGDKVAVGDAYYRCTKDHTSLDAFDISDCWGPYYLVRYWTDNAQVYLWTKETPPIGFQQYKPATLWKPFTNDWVYTGEAVVNTPSNGQMYFNYTEGMLYVWHQGNWVNPTEPTSSMLYIDLNRNLLLNWTGEKMERMPTYDLFVPEVTAGQTDAVQ